MHSKQSASLLSQQFWATFGKYMAPIASAEGEKINWINYKTGVRFIRFAIKTTGKNITVAMEFFHPDAGLQQEQFDLLSTFKKQFEQACGTDWQWQKLITEEEKKIVSRVVATLSNATILNQADWPAIISFLKPRLISLDIFWSNFKFAFE